MSALGGSALPSRCAARPPPPACLWVAGWRKGWFELTLKRDKMWQRNAEAVPIDQGDVPAPLCLRLYDGRAMTYAIFGADGGTPVIALHGTPGSRLRFAPMAATAARLGIKLIAVDRWGYGGSDPHPAPDLGHYGHDLAALADALGLDQFKLMGVSGGGPFAAMAAATLGPRVVRTALVAPVGPIVGIAELNVRRFHRATITVMPRIPGLSRLTFTGFRVLLRLAPEHALALVAARAPTTDRRILGDREVRASLVRCFAEGQKPGLDGPVIDLQLFARKCQPKPTEHATSVRAWLGDGDGNVPRTAARYLDHRALKCRANTQRYVKRAARRRPFLDCDKPKHRVGMACQHLSSPPS